MPAGRRLDSQKTHKSKTRRAERDPLRSPLIRQSVSVDVSARREARIRTPPTGRSDGWRAAAKQAARRRRVHRGTPRHPPDAGAAGCAFLYVLDAETPLDAEALEHRLPGLAEELSRGRGVGFVLARSAEGPVCFRAGKRYQLGDSEPGPFAGRPDAAVVVDGITDLMSMPSAGDLVIYGIDASGGTCRSSRRWALTGALARGNADLHPAPTDRHVAASNHPSDSALRPLHPLS